ncbi:MAG: tetratricopeptide repeat protein [Myxococcales bacterium]|nr:tetratricopeptide repeat protein [Myxococcales bacterium]MCB9643644.1 tetratricopeptide repeat protein [Myxococcales bacterium]
MMMRRLMFFSWGVWVVLAWGCTPQVKVVVWVPPVMKISGIQKVVIIPFRPARWGDRQGFILADRLRKALNSTDARRFVYAVDVQDAPHSFKKNLLRRNVTDLEIRKLLRLSKQKAFVTGRILEYNFTQERLRRHKIRDTDGDSYNLSGAPPLDNYAEHRRAFENSFCLRNRIKITADMWMVDLRHPEPEVVYYTTRTTTLIMERCGRSISTLPKEGAMAQIAYRNLAELLASPMTPERKELTLPLLRNARSVGMRQGLQFAEQGRWDDAERAWRRALAESPDDPRVWYNLGVAAEVHGRFNQALSFYKKALAISPSSLYQDAWERVSQQQALLLEMRKKYASSRRR